jgi:DNA-binding transcriptional regulator PaaX
MTTSSISLPGSWDTTRSKALADLINRSLCQRSTSQKTGSGPRRIASQRQMTPQEFNDAPGGLSWEQRLRTSMQTIAHDSPRANNIIESLWGLNECSQFLQKMILDCSEVVEKERVGFNVGTVTAFMLLLELHEVQFGTSH